MNVLWSRKSSRGLKKTLRILRLTAMTEKSFKHTVRFRKTKKALVFVHGFCEFFGKYHELFYDFYHAGYAVFFYEQRGFGKSLREVSDKDAVYVGNFAEYVEDLKLFTDEVSKMMGKKLDLMLFAHSMGGCVGALYLEKYPETFKSSAELADDEDGT